MTFQEFNQSLTLDQPPAELSALLKALWLDACDDWSGAHDLAQSGSSSDHAWVHAYLHRKEGDRWNASYWYGHAGKSFPKVGLKEEWEALAKTFLGD